MLKLNFTKRGVSDQNHSANAWHNLTLATSINNMELINSSGLAWFRSNRDKTIQDLETQLRRERVNLYVIGATAKKLEINGKTISLRYLNQPHDTKTPSYLLDYRCLPQMDMLAEFTRQDTSYNDNFTKLSETGIYDIEDETEHLSDQDVLDSNELSQMVERNLVTLQLKTLTQEEVNEEMNLDIQRAKIETGEDSKAMPIGQAKDGSVVLAHFVNGNVISQYGLMLCHGPDGKQVVKIILVADKSTWV